MHNSGQLEINTDMKWKDSRYPNVQPYGPIDGNLEYWHSAMKDGTNSYWSIKFNQTQKIKGLDIVLKPGYEESADIYLSEDGTNWGEGTGG